MPCDGVAVVVVVAELEREQALLVVFLATRRADEALVVEDLGDALLQLRATGIDHLRLPRA